MSDRPTPADDPTSLDRILEAMRKHESDRPEEEVVRDRYRFLEKIGGGGMGVVYRARDESLDRDVAIKVVRERAGVNEIVRERFLREARVMGGLSHPNIIEVFDVFEDAGRTFLVMELVEGRNLNEVLAEDRYDLRRSVSILEKVARAIGAAHGKGVVHRDLKPSNVLLTKHDEPKIGDFGLAHLVQADTRLTKTGDVVGTPAYMAPEQVEGSRDRISPRTDVYSLGVILYQMLTTVVPHDADTAMELYGKIILEEPLGPRKVNPAIPADLENISVKAMMKEPRLRYTDAGEMADDLKRWLDGEAVQARAPTMRYRVWKRVRRHRPAWLLGAAAVLLGVATAVVIWTLVQRSNRYSEARDLAVEAERAYDAGEYDRTRNLAGRALRLWPGHEEARYWLTRLKIREYQSMRGVPEARVVRGLVEVIPPRPETPEEKTLRTRIEANLGAGPPLPVATGILALWTGGYDEALREFGKVPGGSAGAWEAEFHAATAHYLKGEFEEAREKLSRHRDRDPFLTMPVWIRTLIALAHQSQIEGKDPEELCVQAATAGQEMGGDVGKVLEAQALIAWGRSKDAVGKNPEPLLDKAFGRIEGLKDPEACAVRGDALLARAEARKRRGLLDLDDPPEYRQAIDAYGGAQYGPGFLRSAEAYMARYKFLKGFGRERKEDLIRAEEDYGKALEHNPDYADAEIGLVEARLEIDIRGTYEPRAKEKAYGDAIDALREIVRRHPSYPPAYHILGFTLTDLAETIGKRGGEPFDVLEEAGRAYTKAIAINPKDTEVLHLRGLAVQNLGVYRGRRGKDPQPQYRAAIEDFTRAIEVNPLHVEAYRYRGTVHQNIALEKAVRGEDPTADFKQALRDQKRAIEINRNDPLSHWNYSAALHHLCLYRIKQGIDPTPDFEAILANLDRALEINPRHIESLHYRALAHMNRGDYLADRGKDPLPEYEWALQDFRQALAINPRDYSVLSSRGIAHHKRARYLWQHGQDP
ncbi:MAG: protein kinase domain-containing protein, partial [Planctomycetota bacterium]